MIQCVNDMMIRSSIAIFVFLVMQHGIVKAHDTLLTAQQAFQIAYDQAKRYVKVSEKWQRYISYDTTRSEWKIESSKSKRVHRLGRCPQEITKVRTVWVSGPKQQVVNRSKRKLKISVPPPYF